MISDPNTPEGAQQLLSVLKEEELAELRQLHADTRAYGRAALTAAKVVPGVAGPADGLAAVHLGMGEFLQGAYRASYENALAENLIKPFACVSGCAFCCYLSVEVTIFGAIAVASYVKNTRPDLAPRLRETAMKVSGLTEAQRAASQIACAFLQPDNTCGVYAVRPSSCGSYFSFDASACEKDRKSGGTLGNIPVYGLPGVLNSMITDGLSAACEDEGLQSCTVELSGAVARILADPMTISRWLAGNHVFEPYRPA